MKTEQKKNSEAIRNTFLPEGQKYIVVKSDNLTDFEKDVNSLLKNGYKLAGNLITQMTKIHEGQYDFKKSYEFLYIQAMILK